MSSLNDEHIIKDAPQEHRKEPRRLKPSDIKYLVKNRILGTGNFPGLQDRYINDRADGKAKVAQLRQAVTSDPGTNPQIWALTTVADPYAHGDKPTPEEYAVHTAMTLYAVHQQSRHRQMYVEKIGLGAAARRLVPFGEEESALGKRFTALVTSSTFAELRYHLRSFISLLRSEEIPLDYGMLAEDLMEFQYPGRAKKIRLCWSRQFALVPPQNNSQAVENTSALTIDSPSTSKEN
ncbi:type I-E CRISPR-associated protein Cse2/CasB [Schaalia sp. ZJ1691]|uniref:type I-E CRISPR-associated protein Cse2/CasB n=1 Tax=Schaalia sp. ZJ1691 TaxID=2709404 RepID=UPI001F150484|nr:type I-E CRISPR-associated protein Cse2/CasB [Schaalia sp. ZJ1691]